MTPPSNPSMDDPINPSHYKDGAIECIEALEACSSPEGFRAHLKLTAMAYLWRYEKKGGIEDVKKARWYIDRLIQCDAIQEVCEALGPSAPNVRYDD